MTEAVTSIRPLAGADEALWCARLMAGSEPWITLGRGLDEAAEILADDEIEKYVALVDNELAGFILIVMKGALVGYIKTIAVAPDFRNRGLGSTLMRFAEDRIFHETPNAFICVSSFNPDAMRLYERCGYKVIGLLPDFVVPDHGEYLLRKSIGTLSEFGQSAQSEPGNDEDS
jgi:ribosomal protein S18 acetylase RimI-like enzyme